MVAKTKYTLALIIYTVVVSFYLSYSLNGYRYLDWWLVTFVFSFYYIGYVIISNAIKESLITIKNVFNIFGFLYTNYYILDCMFLNLPVRENIYIPMNMSYLAIISFNTAYDLTKGTKKTIRKEVFLNIRKFNYGLIAFLLVSISAYYYVAVYKIGLVAYFMASRAEKSLMNSDYSILQFYPYTLPLISTISLFLYMEYKKKLSLFIFLVALLISLTNVILTGSRGEMLTVAFPIVFLLKTYNVISTKFTLLLCVGGFALFGIWKSLYTDNVVVQYDSEFVSWYRICDRILSDNGVDYIWGRSYFDTLINLVVPVTNTESLSTWYVRKYETDVYMAGGGRGFPSVFEAYLNFHLIGVVFVYGMYGYFCKKINKHSVMGMIFYIIVLVSLYKLFRSPAYSFWKNMMWFEIYPSYILYQMSKIRRFHS